MRVRSAPFLLAFPFAFLCGSLPASSGDAAFTGVWRGKIDGLPGMTMVISDEGGDLNGAVLFYLIRRDDGQPPRSSPGLPEPMFHIKSNGDVLDFQVSHRRAHPPGTLNDPPVTFHLRLTGKDQGILIRGQDENSPFQVFRDK